MQRRRRSRVLVAAALALLCASCGSGSRASGEQDEPSATDSGRPSACALVPDDVATAVLGTDRRQETDGPVRAGTGGDGDPGTACTIASRQDGDRFLRLQITTPTGDVDDRERRLRSGPLNPACEQPRRFDEAGGVGVVCADTAPGLTTTRLTSLWGDDEVVTQVTRPGSAEDGDADAAWSLARQAHAAYTDALAAD